MLVGLAGSALGAGSQLLLLFFYRHAFSAADFSSLLMATAVAVSISTISLFNQHVEVLRGLTEVRQLLAPVYGRILALSAVVYLLYETYLARILHAQAQVMILSCYVCVYALVTATGQLYAASSVRSGRKIAEVISRAGFQACLLAGALVFRPTKLEEMLYISLFAGIGFCILQHIYLKRSSATSTVAPGVAAVKVRRGEKFVFSLNVLSDGVAVPLMFAGWAMSLPASLNAEVMFVFRLLNGVAGVAAAGLSMHMARLITGASRARRALVTGILGLGAAPFVLAGLALAGAGLAPTAGNQEGADMSWDVCVALGAWQLLIGIVGALSMVPKFYGKQLHFSTLCVIYNVLLVLAAHNISRISSVDLLVNQRFAVSVLLPSAMMMFILLWLTRLTSHPAQSARAEYA